MELSYFRTFINYNEWANRRILKAAQVLSGAEFQKDMTSSFSFGSLHGTLVHIMGAEWIWSSRWQGVSPKALLKEEDYPTLVSVQTRWQQIMEEMQKFQANLKKEDLARVVQYTNTQGKAFAYPLWQLMMHVCNHSTHHRSEAATIVTHFGHPPDPLDMSVFFTEQRL
jgi:uncharacterized damage-inducible protein DinB